MKYLVTGGAGFIGNALTIQLVKDGHEVVVLDNCNSYYDVKLKESRLARLPESVIVERIDLNDLKALTQIFSRHHFDGVCHLAAQAGVRYSLEAPEQYISSNIVGTFNILEAMRIAGVNKLVYASTSSVYGDTKEVPFMETAAADRPVSVYAATKRAGELLGFTYHQLYDMQVTVLRFFTVYGPWGRPDMSPFIFTDKISRGEPIKVFNDGNMRRDFTYIDDVVSGFVLALSHKVGYEIYNLGNGTPVELMDFIHAVEEAVGRKAEIEFVSIQPGDVTQTYADITKANQELGYRPQIKITDGVIKYVDWYKNYYK